MIASAYMKKLGAGINMGARVNKLARLLSGAKNDAKRGDKLAQRLQKRFFVLEEGSVFSNVY